MAVGGDDSKGPPRAKMPSKRRTLKTSGIEDLSDQHVYREEPNSRSEDIEGPQHIAQEKTPFSGRGTENQRDGEKASEGRRKQGRFRKKGGKFDSKKKS